MSEHAPTPAPRVPEGTRSDTVWVWLIIALPVLSSLLGIAALAEMQRVFPLILELFATEYTPETSEALESESLRLILGHFFSPWIWATLIVGWGGYAASVRFAVLDVRALTARGFARPFPWVWAFFSPVVYVIGRHVVIRRCGGNERAPLVVMIVAQSLAFSIAAYMAVSLNLQILSFILTAAAEAGVRP